MEVNVTNRHLFFTAFTAFLAFLLSWTGSLSASAFHPPLPSEPLKVAVVGLVHDHVHWILGREKAADLEIVAIVESDRQLAQRYSDRYGYSMDMVYSSLEDMYARVRPEAVTAFNAIYDHLKVVEFCAPKGIHVMVEKPLAVSAEYAEKMISLARTHGIHLLTNYETTWYDSHREAYRIIHDSKGIGDIRKIVFYTGHRGPREIGCSEEFLSWLTDPVQNGGGALTDFGCYGANLSTWLMQGQPPLTVTCVTRQKKPDVYPLVDDDATIILTYPQVEVVIQASWDWPYNRKEMEVYGKTGYVFCRNGKDMQWMENEKSGAKPVKAAADQKAVSDPFAYLHKVIRDGYRDTPFNLSSPENNQIVVQILEAARQSSKTGETIIWKDFYRN